MVQPTQTDPQFKLRLPADLKERLQVASSENNRSMNAEIIARLEDSFELGLDKGSRDLVNALLNLFADSGAIDMGKIDQYLTEKGVQKRTP